MCPIKRKKKDICSYSGQILSPYNKLQVGIRRYGSLFNFNTSYAYEIEARTNLREQRLF